MRTRRKLSSTVIAGLAAAVCVLALSAAPAHAQRGSAPGPPPPGDRDPFGPIRERMRREAELRSVGIFGTAKKPDPRAAEAVAEQMRDDFKNIQVLRNSLVRRLKSEQPPDYKSLAAEAEEVNKRAGRLKSDLWGDAAGEEKKEPPRQAEYDEEQMKDALARMCHRIDTFTGNPIFKAPDVVDAQQSARANRDLHDIIRLSANIKRAAERLGKQRP
ncbi:MAG TPA: hypothetical protein VGV38_02695 [Pyrinomonadaceae bacterium]|nr:hypothetical protein [Pyrinomonadaceae bacterium]